MRNVLHYLWFIIFYTIAAQAMDVEILDADPFWEPHADPLPDWMYDNNTNNDGSNTTDNSGDNNTNDGSNNGDTTAADNTGGDTTTDGSHNGDTNIDSSATDGHHDSSTVSQGDLTNDHPVLEDQSGSQWFNQVHYAPFIIGDGTSSRFIKAMATPKLADEEEVESSTISFTASDLQLSVFTVDHFKQASLYAGILAGTGGPFMSFGGGLVGLFESTIQSHQRVQSYEAAQKIKALKRPKSAQDLVDWQVLDRYSYNLNLGAMLPVGAGAIACGAMVAPLLTRVGMVSIEKIDHHHVRLSFQKKIDKGVRAGIAFIIAGSLITALKQTAEMQTLVIDITSSEGKNQLEDWLSYKYIFKGHIEKVPQTDFIQQICHKKTHAKNITTNSLRVWLPLFFKYVQGKRHEVIHEEEMVNEEKRMIDVVDNFSRRKNINNIFKKSNRNNVHHCKQTNDIDRGEINYKNNRIYSAESQLLIRDNQLNKKSYKTARKTIENYVAQRKIQFSWPQQMHGSFLVSLSLKLEHAQILQLIARQFEFIEAIEDKIDVLQKEKTGEKTAKELLVHKEKLKDILLVIEEKIYGHKDKDIINMLGKIIRMIRINSYLMEIVEQMLPNAFTLTLHMSGSHIEPIEKTVKI